MASATRLHALDGVRGLAALMVVFYHVSLLAAPFAAPGPAAEAWSWLTETPLKLLFAGTEAVQVFFVLSGLVVALPALRPGFSWPGFLTSRLLRLYLPVWAAMLVATALIVLVPRSLSEVTGGAWITDANAVAVTPAAFFTEATLTPETYDIVNTLWSLRWELVFSILLPVFVAVAVLLRRWAWPAAAVAVGLAVGGRVWQIDALVYLPAFLLGTLIAVRLDDLRAWSARRTRPVLWTSVGVVSGLLLIASWLGRAVVDHASTAGLALWGLAGAGAGGLILTAIGSRGASRMLETRLPRWLGRISFSLYLVHAPLLATFAFALGDEHWWIASALAVPLSLALATAFQRWVEAPAHRLARAVGRRVDAALGHPELRPASAAPAGATTGAPAVEPSEAAPR